MRAARGAGSVHVLPSATTETSFFLNIMVLNELKLNVPKNGQPLWLPDYWIR